MTYAQGGLIQAADFNGFASLGSPNINNMWSTGSGSTGYGQTAVPSATVGAIVNYSEWASLINAINNSALHQGTAMTALPVPASTDEITYLADLSTDLSLVTTNRLNCSASGTDITTTGTRTADWGTNASIPTVSSTVTVTFASAAQARYFFNCGGTIRLSCSRSGGTSTPVNTAWTDLCTNLGTLGLPAVSTAQTIASASYTGLTRFGGGGYAPDIYTRTGFYGLTSTPEILFRQFTSGSYSSDNITVSYSATETVVTITVLFTDDSSDATNVTGNLSVTATARPSETTYIANTWGTPVVAVSAPA